MTEVVRICTNCSFFFPDTFDWTENGICLADPSFEPYLDALFAGDFESCRTLIEEKRIEGTREGCGRFEEVEDSELPDNWPLETIPNQTAIRGEASDIPGCSFAEHSFSWLLEHNEQLQALRCEHQKLSREERRMAADHVYHAHLADQLFQETIGESAEPAAIPGEIIALTIDPEYAPAILTVGTHEYLLGRHDEAERLLLSLIDLPKESEDLITIIDKAGRFLLDRGDHDRARKLYTAANLKFPDEEKFRAGIAFASDKTMPPANFKCKQCGHCCLNLSGAFEECASEEDILLWEAHGRDDILEWVDVIPLGEDHQVYDLWVNPRTGEDVTRCPWLRKLPRQNKYICRIHDMKPEHCREYPHSRDHAERTGCLGFDEGRRTDDEQT